MIESTFVNSTENFRIGRKKITPDFSMKDAHFHSYYELYYMVSGSCNMFINQAQYHIKSGDLVLINKMDIHQTFNYSQGDNERIVINFTDYYLKDIYDEYGRKLISEILTYRHITVHSGRREHLENLLNLMEYEYPLKEDFNPFLCRLHFYELLIFIFQMKKFQSEEISLNKLIDDKIKVAAQYISKFYYEEITLNKVAKHVNMSPTYFSKKFKAITGFGFKEYLIQVRLKEAAVKLLETDISITEISLSCGFNDSAYFSELFKRVKGISPREYRKTSEIF